VISVAPQALNSVREIAGNGCKSPQRPDLQREILALAGRQHGHVTRTQLLGLGVGRGAITGRLEAGEYAAVHAGVYCIGPRRDDPVSRAAAAVLACGEGTALSHASAASLWEFLPRWSFPLEVMARGERERPGITAHRCQSLTRRDITRQRGIPTTSPARTALDIAPRLSKKGLTRLVNDARRDGYLRLPALTDVLQRNPRHPGTKLLRPFVENPRNPTRSPLEDAFLALVEKYDLPTPHINVHRNGREIDAIFPAHHLIVEMDGWDYHKDQEAFEDDRERDADNLDHGLGTVRITERRLKENSDHEAARLRRILNRSGAVDSG
jgi:hypothetical protein